MIRIILTKSLYNYSHAGDYGKVEYSSCWFHTLWCFMLWCILLLSGSACVWLYLDPNIWETRMLRCHNLILHVWNHFDAGVFRSESYFSLANCKNESLRQNEKQGNGYCIVRNCYIVLCCCNWLLHVLNMLEFVTSSLNLFEVIGCWHLKWNK